LPTTDGWFGRFRKVFSIEQDKELMMSVLWLGISQIGEVFSSLREITDKVKRVMVCHAMSTSACHATSVKNDG